MAASVARVMHFARRRKAVAIATARVAGGSGRTSKRTPSNRVWTLASMERRLGRLLQLGEESARVCNHCARRFDEPLKQDDEAAGPLGCGRFSRLQLVLWWRHRPSPKSPIPTSQRSDAVLVPHEY